MTGTCQVAQKGRHDFPKSPSMLTNNPDVVPETEFWITIPFPSQGEPCRIVSDGKSDLKGPSFVERNCFLTPDFVLQPLNRKEPLASPALSCHPVEQELSIFILM